MSSTTAHPWTLHATRTLTAAGHRASAARDEVIAALAKLGCSVSARELADHLHERGSGVGQASIYRALELLDRHGLVQRFDVGEGVARYEPAHADGDHHHHIVCQRCGKVEPFSDDALESAIHELAGRTSFDVATHDVTLRGQCPACQP